MTVADDGRCPLREILDGPVGRCYHQLGGQKPDTREDLFESARSALERNGGAAAFVLGGMALSKEKG